MINQNKTPPVFFSQNDVNIFSNLNANKTLSAPVSQESNDGRILKEEKASISTASLNQNPKGNDARIYPNLPQDTTSPDLASHDRASNLGDGRIYPDITKDLTSSVKYNTVNPLK